MKTTRTLPPAKKCSTSRGFKDFRTNRLTALLTDSEKLNALKSTLTPVERTILEIVAEAVQRVREGGGDET